MRLEHHLVGGYVRYISPHIIIIVLVSVNGKILPGVSVCNFVESVSKVSQCLCILSTAGIAYKSKFMDTP